jgi:hypothetical protein
VPLLVDQLQLWTVGFKWAGLDPERVWPRIPTPVRDLFATLLEAILKDQLKCMTLAPEKWDGKDPEDAPFFVRHWSDDINRAVHYQRFRRKLLRHAVLDRTDFKDWCERRSIPLPEFWYPPGWTEYRWPEDDEPAGAAPQAAVASAAGDGEDAVHSGRDAQEAAEAPEASAEDLRPSQRARLACQVIATNIWRDEPTLTIAAMSKDERLRLGGADYYDEITVKRWVQAVAPSEVSARRGRPKKKSGTESR